MGISKLEAICGLKVVDAILAEGDTGICFENGASLSIYNRYKLFGFDTSDAQVLIGQVVTHVNDDINAVTIIFGNNSEIRIELVDDAYTGPEAIQFRVPGEPIVVWN
jgi:hypothetical protein